MEDEIFQMQKFARDGKMDTPPLNLYDQTQTTTDSVISSIWNTTYTNDKPERTKNLVFPHQVIAQFANEHRVCAQGLSPTLQPFPCDSLSHTIDSFFTVLILPWNIFYL